MLEINMIIRRINIQKNLMKYHAIISREISINFFYRAERAIR